MSEHVNQWLSAYSDGELHGALLHQVENHLGECAQCQAELELLAGLSNLLRETAPTGDFFSTERFVSQLTLSLPRQPKKTRSTKMLEISWWLIPFGVMAVWAFLQVTYALSAVTLNASDAGLLGNWLQANPPQTEWFAWLTNLFGGQLGLAGQTALLYLNNVDLFLEGLVGQFIWQALLALVYLGWLASWFMRSDQSSNSGGMEFSAQ